MAELKDKICIVTGASSGIGKAVTISLARLGAQVTMVSRDKPRGQMAYDEVRQIAGDNVNWIPADLSSKRSVEHMVDLFRHQHEKLDILFNCAGENIMKKEMTPEGFDRLFFTNYLSHFLLTNLLFEPLKNAAPSKVITISGSSHKAKHGEGNFDAAMDFDDLQGNQHYSYVKYAKQYVLAKVLFTYELSRRWEPYGIASVTLCPGLTRTNHTDTMPLPLRMLVPLIYFMRKKETQTPDEGAAHLIHLAERSNKEINCKYFEGSKSGLTEAKSSKESYDLPEAQMLWNASLGLLNLKLDY